MDKDVYVQLRETLDGMGISFPAVPDVDVAYLKKFFTEDQARVFIAMEDRFQPVEEVATRLNRSPDEVKSVLDVMAHKGLVMTTTRTEPTFYAPLPWLMGWGDWTAYYEDKDAAELGGAYKRGFRAKAKNYKRNIFRTVPVREAIPDKSAVASYDDVTKIVEKAGSISVADCYCDKHRQLRGQDIYEPLERCFLFGVYADFLVEKGYGRRVSPQEAIEILDKCKDAGLVPNVCDLQNPSFICNCGDHCGGNLTRRQPPGPFVDYAKTSNYYSMVDSDLCTGCGTCVDLCWFKAISMGSKGLAQINQKVCEGCGLCVTKCPTEGLSLKKKPESEHYTPPVVHPNMRSSEEYKADLERYKDIIKPR